MRKKILEPVLLGTILSIVGFATQSHAEWSSSCTKGEANDEQKIEASPPILVPTDKALKCATNQDLIKNNPNFSKAYLDKWCRKVAELPNSQESLNERTLAVQNIQKSCALVSQFYEQGKQTSVLGNIKQSSESLKRNTVG